MLLYRLRQMAFTASAVALVAFAFSPHQARASTATAFRPVSPDELKMTAESLAPGAPAIILYREVYRDDTFAPPHEDVYFRIKIFTDEGRKYADIEIPFDKNNEDIASVQARTIKPDGSIVDFDGKVFTKWIVKGRGYRYLAKTFTLPDVQPGCIIEYYYVRNTNQRYTINPSWVITQDLFTKAVKFTLKPYTLDNPNVPWRLSLQHMPANTPPAKEGPDHVIRLEVSEVPALPTEDFMPPPEELKARIDFRYIWESGGRPETDPNRFWLKVGKTQGDNLERFLGKPKALEEAVSAVVAPNDPPEVKLQKIYARIQQMRNTSYEVQKTEEEEKREKQKEPTSAEEAWKRGYANRVDLTWLFLALVRAAGFEAQGVMLADRGNYFFDRQRMQSDRLNENAALIKLNGKDIWCDPGWAFTPFGLLPWQETGIEGLLLEKEPSWVPTLIPSSAQARTERHADLTLTETGDLEGKLTVTYTGLVAANLRMDERNADQTGRTKYLEDEVKGSIPTACEVKLTNQLEWQDSARPLVAEFEVKIPGWASPGKGRHLLLSAGLFSAHEKHVFEHEARLYPIYIPYPYVDADDLHIQMPSGWKVASLPTGWHDVEKIISYNLAAENDKNQIHVSRELKLEFIILDPRLYQPLRQYFQEIKATDEQQIVLESGGPTASK